MEGVSQAGSLRFFFNDNIDNGNNGHTATCGVLRGAAAVVCVVIVRVKGYRLWVMEFTGWQPALLFLTTT